MPVRRIDGPSLVAGSARFVGDLSLDGMVHAAVIRSPAAHARIVAVDATPGLQLAGVLDVITPDVVARATRELPCFVATGRQHQMSCPGVPHAVTRYGGEPLGLVIARTPAIAADAVDAVRLEFEDLPAVPSLDVALENTVLLYPEWGTNVAVQLDLGDPREVVEAIIARAAHVVSMR